MLKAAWAPFTDNLGVTLGGAAVLTLVPTIVIMIPTVLACGIVIFLSGVTDKLGKIWAVMPIVAIGMILFAVGYNAIRVGWTRMLLKLASGEQTSIGEIWKGKPWFLNFLLVNVIIGLGTAVGAAMFVVPGIIFAVYTAMAPFLVAETNMDPVQAIKESFRLVRGYELQLALFYLLLLGANTVVGFVPIIGMFLPIAVMALFDLALAMIYIMRRTGPAQVGYIAER